MKKILISGSTSGIGRGLTERLLLENYSVIGLARNHDKFDPKSQYYFPESIDFSDLVQLEDKLLNIKKKHADVDALICCAGYGYFAELEQFSLKQIQNIFNVNVLSQILLIKTYLPLFKQRKQGKIIIIGSEAALAGAKKGSIYCASKFALRGFCQSLRQECRAANISVSLINPGLVRTPFFEELSFEPGIEDRHALSVNDVIEALWLVIQASAHCVLEEINLQPLCSQVKIKNKPIDTDFY